MMNPFDPRSSTDDVIDVQPKPSFRQRQYKKLTTAFDVCISCFEKWVDAISPKSVIDSSSGLTDLHPPTRARWSLRVMGVGLLLLLVWSAIGKIDQVTRAQAQIIAAERTQLVQSSDGGVLTQLHVKEGDVVKAGQLLATLQKERAAAAVSDSSAKVAALNITLARLHAEVYGKPLVFDKELLVYNDYIRNQTDLYNKRQTAFKDDIRALQDILALGEDELRINRQLEASGDVSRAEILRLQRSVADIRAQLASKRNKYFQDAQAEMTKAQEELSTQTEQLKDRSQVLEHTELVAPIDAVVNNIKVNTIAPLAGTRMTEDIMPEEAFKAFNPVNVVPAALFLVSEDCPTNTIMGAGGGFFHTANITMTRGVALPEGQRTPEAVAEHWAKISDRTGETVPQSGAEQSMAAIQRLQGN